MAEHIQRITDENTANIPTWFGEPVKDVFTLATYIGKLDTARDLLQLDDATTFRYFSQSLRGSAASWLDTWLVENRHLPQHWSEVRPHFRQAFGDKTSTATFAKDVSSAKLEDFGGDFYKFYAHIGKLVDLHCEPFLFQPIDLGDEEHDFDDDQIRRIITINTRTIRAIHSKLTLEFFLHGLPKDMFQKVATKPNLTKPSQIIDFLKRSDEQLRKEAILPQNPPPPMPHPPPHPAAYVTPVGETFTQANTYSQAYASKYGGNSQQKIRKSKARLCIYCRKPNHSQERCFTRIRDNQPCLTPKGEAYWPNKVAATAQTDDVTHDVTQEAQPQTNSQEAQPQAFSVFHNEVL